MLRRISAALILSIGVAMAPTSVDAQQHDHGADQMQPSSGMMGSQMMTYMPQRLLAMQESLKLSEDQRTRLQELAEAASERSRGHMEQMMAHGQGTCEMPSGDEPDWSAYEEQMEAMAAGMVAGHVSMMRTAVDARSVLSTEQIETVSSAAVMQHGMHGGEGDDAMMRGGIMQGGMMQMMNGVCMGGTG